MKNKSRKSKNWKHLFQQNWLLAHEIADLAHDHICQIPNCNRTEELDLDHVFSREVRTLFFEPDNLGYLCKEHHTHKSFRKGQWVDMMVRQICQQRIGDNRWNWLMLTSKKICPDFCTIYHQEQVNCYLTERLNELKKISK